MSSASLPYRRIRARLRTSLFVGLFAFALVAASGLGVADSASAQSTYGNSSYGTEIYSADDGVRPPNTGFEVVVKATTEQPVPFWGGACAIGVAVVASALFVRRALERKQRSF